MPIDVSDLSGDLGAQIIDSDEFRLVTDSVASVGDINGDGIEDFVVTGRFSNPTIQTAYTYNENTYYYDRYSDGGVYVIFGSGAPIGDTIDVATLDGTNGFALGDFDGTGYSDIRVSTAGDINGDGFDDLLIGRKDGGPNVAYDTPYGTYYGNAGEAFVVFGTDQGFAPVIELSALSGADGFRINGPNVGDSDFGQSVSGGFDFNGDGVDDILINDPNTGTYGEAFIVFGDAATPFPADLDIATLDGTNGFRITGSADFRITDAAALIGDVNGDGFADLLIGDRRAGYDPSTYATSGGAFILFGDGGPFSASVSLDALSPADGVEITSAGANQNFGQVVAAIGDVNGDGVEDFLISAPRGGGFSDGYYGRVGAAYVIFGDDQGMRASLSVDALDGTNGFAIVGDAAFNSLGFIAGCVGDINGDGFDDFAIAAKAEYGDYQQNNPLYFVFGQAAPSATLNLATLTASEGFALFAGQASDVAGIGDIDGDGFGDVAIAAGANRSYDATSSILFGSALLGGANDAPVAQDDAFVLSGTTVVSLAADNGGGIDLDPDLSTLTVSAINGTPVSVGDFVTLASGIRVVFLGGDQVRIEGAGFALGQSAVDSFIYTITDGELEDTATVSVDLTQIDRPLIADGVQATRITEQRDFQIIGDVNGDGIADFLGAEPRTFENLGDYTYAYGVGEAFVVFGSATGFGSSISPRRDLNGSNGFILSGADNYDYLGQSISAAGDFNGDGFADFIVSQDDVYDPATGGNRHTAFLVFGTDQGFPAEFTTADIDGSNGIVLTGPRMNAYNSGSALTISSAGDVNGDGFDDVIIAHQNALATITYYDYYTQQNATGERPAGKAYVVFGSADPVAALGLEQGEGQPAAAFDVELVDGTNGFGFQASNDYAGIGRVAAAIGDINGDGFDDIAVRSNSGTSFDYATYGAVYGGQVHVIFGTDQGFAQSIDVSDLNGANGFSITGSLGDNNVGGAIAAVGDVNGDGIDDFVITSSDNYGGYGQPYDGGAGIVVFGRDHLTESFNAGLTTGQIDATNGFRITTDNDLANLGVSVSGAGDLNNDGFDDIVITAGGGGGAAYVIYGVGAVAGGIFNVGDIDGANGFRVPTLGGPYYNANVTGGADLNGDGVEDIIISSGGGDAFILNGGVSPTAAPFVGTGSYEFSDTAIYARGYGQGELGTLFVSGDLGAVNQPSLYVRAGGYQSDGRITLDGGAGGVTVTLQGDRNQNPSANISVGTDSGSMSELNVLNGARLISNNDGYYYAGSGYVRGGYYNLNIGRNGGTGSVLVDGAGSFIGAYGIGARVTVGRGTGYERYTYGQVPGDGTLTVSGGGVVGSLGFNIGRDGGVGVVTVTGSGSVVRASSDYGVYDRFQGEDLSGDAGGFQIGRSGGEGRVYIVDGGLIEVRNADGLTDNPFINLGREADAYGLIRVDGAGSELRVEQVGVQGDDDEGGAFVGVGRQGQGVLEVSNGGVVNVLGDRATLDLGNNFLGGTPTSAENRLSVTSGGVVNVNSYNGEFGGMRIARSEGSNGTVIVDGAGSRINITTDAATPADYSEGAFLQIGRAGDGRLEVTNGGVITIDGGAEKFPLFMVGVENGSTGYARIDGAGSQVVVTGVNTSELASDGFVSISRSDGSRGELVISNGGVLSNDGVTSGSEIAGNEGTHGRVTVTGAGSQFLAGTRLGVGSDFDTVNQQSLFDVGGGGVLSIYDGGAVTAGYAAFGDTGVLNIRGGSLVAEVISTGAFNVGGAAAIGAANVVGGFTQLAGAVTFEFTGFGAGGGDQLDVTGDAEIDAGAILFDFAGLATLSAGDSFTFLTVGGVLTIDETAIDVTGAPGGASFSVARANVGGVERLSLVVDAAPANTVGIVGFDQALPEGDPGDDTVFTYTIERAGDLSVALTVDFAVTGAGDFPADGADFEGGALPAGQVSFAAGEATATIDIRVAEDGLGEGDNGFMLTLSNPQSGAAEEYQIVNATSGGMIENDDAPAVIGFTNLDFFAQLIEGNPGDANFVVFDLLRSNSLDGEITVNYLIEAPGFGILSAEADDLEGPLAGQITFGDGAATAQIAVAIAEDAQIEGLEDFRITLAGVAGEPGAAILTDARATGRILNDDGAYADNFIAAGFAGVDSDNIFGTIFAGGEQYDYYAGSTFLDGDLTITGDDNPIHLTVRRVEAGSGYGVTGSITISGGANPVEIVSTDIDNNSDFSSIRVGVQGGAGELTINGGATVVSNADANVPSGNYGGYYQVNIGRSNGVGVATVDGPGSFLGAYGLGARITVGRNGNLAPDGNGGYAPTANGVLNITNGAGVGAGDVNVGRDTAAGTVNVSGEGSFLNISSSYGQFGVFNGNDYSGSAGGLNAGRNGAADGRVYVTGGGDATISNVDGLTDNPFAIFGRDDGYGRLTVDGAGSTFNVTQIGVLDDASSGAFLGFGRSGEGYGEVKNGGAINVTGSDATLMIGFHPSNYVSNGIESRLEISTGGVVNVDSGDGGDPARVVIGNAVNSNGVLTVDGAGSALNVAGNKDDGVAYGATVIVGDDGNGRLEVTNGGQVAIDGGADFGPAFIVGDGTFNGAGGYGYALVNGGGSSVTITGTSAREYAGAGFISVGRNSGAEGVLRIENGGAVSNGDVNTSTEIGGRAGSNGQVTVTGAGSRLDAGAILAISSAGPNNAYDLYDGGTGALTITSGGLVTAGRTLLGSLGTLNIDGGLLQSDVGSVGQINVGGAENIGTAEIDGALLVTGGEIDFEFVNFSANGGDRLDVIGDVDIDAANLTLDFSAVGALSAGDAFTFLTVTGALTLDIAAIDLSAINDGVGAEVSIRRQTVSDGAGGAVEEVSVVVDVAPPMSVGFAGVDQSQPEGDPGGATLYIFTVERAGADLADALTVDFAVSGAGGSPASATDFEGGVIPSGQVVFAPGETSATIEIAIAGDFVVEGDEAFAVTLSNPQTDFASGAEITNAEIGATIENDDAPGVVSIQSFSSADEGDTGDANTVDFTVTRSGNTFGEVTVDFFVEADGTAGAADLTGGAFQTGQVTFADGQATATISVGIVGDTVIEGAETFSVTLTGLSGPATQTVFGQVNATGQINNDDGETPVLPGGREADIFGDPHIVTLDGLGFDFQAVGEFTLVEGVAEGDPLNVQVRTAPVPGSDLVSVITAMATDMGGGVSLMLDAFAASALLVDGVPTDVPDSGAEPISVGDGQVFFDGEAYTIIYGSGEGLVVKVDDGSLNVCVFLDPDRADGSVRGLMGNSDGDFANDFILRNGDPIPAESISFDPNTGAPSLDFDFLYGTYADSWRIDDAGSLFFYSGAAGDSGTADYTDLNFPAAALSLDDLPAELLADAIAAVDAAGITDPVLRDAALLDFALTGDDKFIAGAAGVAADPEVETTPTNAPVLPDTVGVIAGAATVVEGDEGETAVVFNFYRIGPATGALSVGYEIGGDVDADDFAPGTAFSGQVDFADGESFATLTLQVRGDGLFEAVERIRITLSAPEGVLVGAPSAISSILADDAAPVALDDAFATTEDDTLILTVAQLLANDFDSDGDTPVVSAVDATSAKGASVSFANGQIVYDPSGPFEALAAGETDTDTFVYTIDDGAGGTDVATVTVTINGLDENIGGPGPDLLVGDDEPNRLEGNGGDDTLRGEGGNDTLFGGDGADEILGGAGDDQIFGGEGNDALSGEDGDDSIVGDGGDDNLSGGEGGDSLFGGDDDDILSGDAGTDSLDGGAGDDQLDGGSGGDVLRGGSGADRLSGASGNDRLIGNSGNDALNGGGGNDQMAGGGGDDRLIGGGGRDNINGGGGNDFLNGGGGDDRLVGAGGNDRLNGANGNDVLSGGGGADRMNGGGGNDRMIGGAGNDRMAGAGGRDVMNGGGGRDNISGGGGDDRLLGGGGNDRLNGGGGRDELIAGGGRDLLVGGGGADVFTFRSNDSVNMIRDFRNNSDKIKILNGANSFDDLRISDFQGDAMIKFGRTTIRLDGVDSSVLDADDFIF